MVGTCHVQHSEAPTWPYLETGQFQKYHSDLNTPETDLCPNEVTFWGPREFNISNPWTLFFFPPRGGGGIIWLTTHAHTSYIHREWMKNEKGKRACLATIPLPSDQVIARVWLYLLHQLEFCKVSRYSVSSWVFMNTDVSSDVSCDRIWIVHRFIAAKVQCKSLWGMKPIQLNLQSGFW